jgi:hypothetical protein
MSCLAGSGDLLPAPIPAVNTVMLANFSRPRSDELCACDWDDFRALRDAELGLALGDDFGCLRPGYQYGLRLHLLGYAETIEDTCEMDTARATSCGVRIDNRSSVNRRPN